MVRLLGVWCIVDNELYRQKPHGIRRFNFTLLLLWIFIHVLFSYRRKKSSRKLWIQTYELEREVWLHTGPAFSRLDRYDAMGLALTRDICISYFEKYVAEHFKFSSKLTLTYQNVTPFFFVLCNNNCAPPPHKDRNRAPHLLKPALLYIFKTHVDLKCMCDYF